MEEMLGRRMTGEGKQKRKIRDPGPPRLDTELLGSSGTRTRSQGGKMCSFGAKQIWIQILTLVMRLWAGHKLSESQLSHLQNGELLVDG